MIKKLNFPPYGTQDEWINKINELVDVINGILATQEQYAYTMTDDKSEDIKIIIRPGKAGEDNITKEEDWK